MSASDRKIKMEIVGRGLTISGIAEALSADGVPCRREELSMCIWRHRRYPRLRAALAKYLGISQEQLFADEKLGEDR